ncbi:MaoC/PaaZ C-terminal domain-containing protein [Marinobacteraceae bacterium S3BR75-40.1]
MNGSIRYQHKPPALWPFYGKALFARGNKGSQIEIPQLEAELLGVSTDTDRLARYRKVCGFQPGINLPMTWPHILAFPLHMRLLTDPAFPLPLLGLVHLRNQITQHRPLRQGECFDLHCHLANQQQTERGLEFDLVTQAYSSGRLIWEELSTTLHRQPQAGGKSKKSQNQLPRYPHTQQITAPDDTGRRYGRVSGDLNPIHIHSLTARAFGFPRAIAHGMWSKAQSLAILEQQTGWRSEGVTVEVAFKKPLFLPGKAQLNWDTQTSRWPFQLLNAKGDAPHLTGEVRWD